jgi:hypothetical protein
MSTHRVAAPALAIALAAALSAGPALARQEKGKGKAPQPEMPPEMVEVMKLAQPGPHHMHMERFVGTWKAKARSWMDPNGPPTESEGTMKVSPVLGGRFFRSDFEGTFMESPFTGMGLDGYDNLKQKHVGMWVDTWGTMMMVYEGECSENGKVTTLYSHFIDPATKKPMDVRMVTTWVDEKTPRFEMYCTLAGEKEIKMMEMTYTRQ